jgi:tetratricopeptide (TPR) repeat protein
MPKLQSKSRRREVPPAILDAYRLQMAGRSADAEAQYRQILVAEPDQPEALHQLGLICRERRQFPEALELLIACTKSDRGSAEALSNCGVVLIDLNRHGEALTYLDRALVLQPNFVPALYNRGQALAVLGRHQDALRSFDRVLARDPVHVDAHYGRGNALRELRRHDEALASYRRACGLAPERADIHMDEALTLLRLGDFRAGWQKYAWRWRKLGLGARFAQPPWLGGQHADDPDDLHGRTILLHAEQGHGDTIQFVRYAALVAARGARVVLEVQPALKTLMQSLPGPAVVTSQDDAVPAFDLHCPLLSLPLAFGTELASIPGGVPYLKAAPDRLAIWQARLAGTKRRRVGLVWSGSQDFVEDRKRSIPLDRLAPLLDLPDIDVIGLQRDVPAADHAAMQAGALTNLGAELRDFADTAAVISLLDLVISVDTAVAHLAGALAIPVWILLPASPDFRWMLDREDSPWYPSARLFRQPSPGDWTSVIARVQADMRAWNARPAA